MQSLKENVLANKNPVKYNYNKWRKSDEQNFFVQHRVNEGTGD